MVKVMNMKCPQCGYPISESDLSIAGGITREDALKLKAGLGSQGAWTEVIMDHTYTSFDADAVYEG